MSDVESGSPLYTGRRLLGLAVLVVVIFVLNRVVLDLVGLLPAGTNWLKVKIIAHQCLAILFPVLLFVAVMRLPARPALGLTRPHRGRMAVAVPVGLGLIYLVNTWLPRLLAPTEHLTQSSNAITAFDSPWSLLLTIAAISVAAPLADELYLRGLLLHALKSRWGAAVAILATAALTASSHALEPFKITHAFLMGCLFAGAVVWTRSVTTSLILHALHNSLSFFMPG